MIRVFKYPINTILYTKDGRQVGNSIIFDYDDNLNYIIKTDYGNTLIMSEADIEASFYIQNSSELPEGYIESHKNYNPIN